MADSRDLEIEVKGALSTRFTLEETPSTGCKWVHDIRDRLIVSASVHPDPAAKDKSGDIIEGKTVQKEFVVVADREGTYETRFDYVDPKEGKPVETVNVKIKFLK